MDWLSLEITWYMVGLLTWLLCSLLGWLGIYTYTHLPTQRSISSCALVIAGLGWLILLVALLFIIPDEATGTYLDVYANQALANLSVMVMMAVACWVIFLSNRLVGIGFYLVFTLIFIAIGGKGIGDALAPLTISATIDYLDMTKGHLIASLTSGYGYMLTVSTPMAHFLEQQGLLADITDNSHQVLSKPVVTDVLIAPYSSYLYLPSEYGFSKFGKCLFYVLLTTFLLMISALIVGFFGIKKSSK